MHPLETQFRSQLPSAQLRGLTSIVAVSGGPDSVALLRLLTCDSSQLTEDRIDLVIGHFNHQARPAADREERFVIQLAEACGLPCVVGRPNNPGRTAASEELWRHERYAFLTELAHNEGARYLLTGHTADDQAETVLFNIMRGTGLKGLCGIPAVRQIDESLSLKRPLLTFSRDELLRYLEHLGQPFMTDSSNSDRRFTRNQIRHMLLPLIETLVPGDPREALVRLSNLALEWAAEINPKVQAALDAAVRSITESKVEIDCAALAAQSPYVIREALGDLWRRMEYPAGEMTYTKRVALAELVKLKTNAVVTFPGGVRAIKQGTMLQLALVDPV